MSILQRSAWGLIVGASTLIILSFWSCDPEQNFLTGDSVAISFELDTLHFDTVFTELGSATRSVKIYNDSNEPIKLDRVFVEGTTGVEFRFNADGFPGGEVEDLIIWDNDSIYVFVEVTIDPDQPLSLSPFIIEDRLVVQTGEKQQSVILEAWGQNANYFPSRFNKGVPVVLSCDNQTITWDSELPYVVYGEIFVDSCLLEITAGRQIYMHGGIASNEFFNVFNDGFFFMLPEGKIHIAGTRDEPVVIQGDRLEEGFQDQPGQWAGIYLGAGSQGNVIEHAVIKNGIFGVNVDSTASLSIHDSQIHTTSGSALRANRGTIEATNCLFYDNGTNALQFVQGGNYNFDHCTVANFGVDASALALSNFQCYDALCEVFSVYRLQADFRNCIFFGSRRDELILSDAAERTDPGLFQLQLTNCVVKVDELLENNEGRYQDFFTTICQDCIDGEREDPLFLARDEDDYHLDTLSIAQDIGLVLPGLEFDLDGVMRDAMPDIGCFERVD